jgi:hypothetical protein
MLFANSLSVLVWIGFLFCPGQALAQNPDTIACIIREECENWLQPQKEITIVALKNCYGKIHLRLRERSAGKVVFTDQEIQDLFNWLPQASGPERLLAYDILFRYSIARSSGESASSQLKSMRCLQRELILALRTNKSFRDSYYDFLIATGNVGGSGFVVFGAAHTQDMIIEKLERSITQNVTKLKKEDELALFFSSVQMDLLNEMLAFDGFFPINLSDEPTKESVLKLIAEYRAWRKSFRGDFLVLDPWTTKICYRPGQAILSGVLGVVGIFKGLYTSPCRFKYWILEGLVRDPIQFMEFGRRLDCYSLPFARSFKGLATEEQAVFELFSTVKFGFGNW